MAECGKQVGAGVVAYPCIIEVDGGPHAGPCAARENMRSMNERSKWESARERADASGVPTLEGLGMQGKPKTVIEGLLDPESGKGRRIHPDELRRIQDGFDTSHTEEASLETRLVQTAGGVDLSGIGVALSQLPDQLSKIIETPVDAQAPSGSFGAVKSFQEAQSPKWEPRIVGESNKNLPRTTSDLHVHDLVIEDVAERKSLGIRRYGTPLTPFNGRNAAQDAYEEALDLAAYFRQVLLERDAAAVALYELGEILGSYFDDHIPSDVEDRLVTIANALV